MKNRVNKQIIKALSVGLAASMALQPVTAFAEGTEGDTTEGSVPSSAVDTNAPIPQDIPNGPADEAQNVAKVVSNDVPAPAEESPAKNERGDLNITADDVAVVTDDILVNHAENGADATNVIAGEAGTVEKVVKDENGNTIYDENGKEVKVEVDAAQDVITDASLLKNDTNLSGATTDIENTKKDLIIAENADRDENNLATAASSVVKDIQTETAEVEKEVNKAVEQANTLANNIKNASSIPAAQKAYDDLDQLVKDTQDAVKTYNKDLYGEDGKGGLMAKYAAALKLLDNAQSRYDDAIGEKATEEIPGTGAKGSVEAAKKKVDDAQKTVDDLAGAIAAAQSNIATMTEGARAIVELQKSIIEDAAEGKVDSQKQKNLFEQVMKTFYVNSMIDENATNVQVVKSDNGYFTVTYDIGDTSETKYFGLDTTNGQFLMYAKSADEVAAIEHLAAYEQQNPDVDATKKSVYKYSDAQNNVHFITLAEIEGRNDIKKVGDNYYVMNGTGTVTALVSPVAAPTSKDGIRVGEANKVTAVTIANDSVASDDVYLLDDDGHLVKTSKATVTRTDYIREQQTQAAYYKQKYSPEQKQAIISQLGDNVSFVEFTDVESRQTYYQITGSYVPVFTIRIKHDEIKEYVNINNGEKKAKEAFLKRITDLGFTITDSKDLRSEWKWDIDGKWNNEEYYVWGTVDFEGQKVTISGGEFTNLHDALIDFENKYNKNHDQYIDVNSDGVLDEGLTVETVDYVGVTPFVDAGDPYYKNQTFDQEYWNNWNFFAGYKNYEQSGRNGYKKWSVCVDYLKAVVASQDKENVSKTTYENSIKAIQIIQDELKNGDGHFDVNDSTQNQDLMKLLDDAKNLVEKYQGYAEAIATVQGDISTTETDIERLSAAIDELDQNHRAKTAGQVLAPVLGNNSIAKYFNVTDEDIIGFFKVQNAEAFKESDPEGYEKFIQDRKDDLGKMKIDNFENFLDYLKKKAESKKKDIEDQLKNLEEQRDQSEKDLQDTINRLTPPSGDDEEYPPRDPDADSTVVNPVVRPVVTQVVANDGQAVLGEVRKTSTRKSTAKAAADTETTAVDNSNSDNAEVAGAQKEETKTPEAPKEETKIEDNETALAATPELEEKGFAWWWLLILAAIAGVSVEEYARRKSNKAKAEAKDSTKINK